MTTFFDNLFTRYPVKTRRFLELLPGAFSWTLILFPIWGSLLIPYVLAYFILFFDVYWFYKSFSLAITAYIASKKIKAAEKQDWLKLAKENKNFSKVTHVIIIPNYTESAAKLRETIKTIADQTFPRKQIYVVLAMEEREANGKEKAEILIKEFKNTFGRIFAAYHPDIPGEVKGKSSNENYAARTAYKDLVEKEIIDINYATISSVDADSLFDKQYFACLSYKFLNDSLRYNKFWQSANVFYSNIWKVPAPTRIISFFGSLWRTAVLLHGDRLISNSTYSLSFLMLKNIDFWDVDVIPEDYRIFFKAFYMLKGKAWAEPIFLQTSMDAPLSAGYIKSLKNKYQQEQRWSWGVSDDPLFIKWWLTVPNVPFIRKTIILYNVLIDHFLWPVNWFIITIAANIMPFINPVFSRTTLGYNLPKLAGVILTSCIFALLAMIIVDFRNRPSQTSRVKQFLFPLEFILLPVVGFFLSTLPALISHTKLMLGKRMEYKVTEKV
ncbi:glycosyltransferase family 2 protein [Candidatus Microgenomates bacterium]|nr:MAG: glycosyltransferase family 2 protein [Candidatus Microgenomates bacterium]